MFLFFLGGSCYMKRTSIFMGLALLVVARLPQQHYRS